MLGVIENAIAILTFAIAVFAALVVIKHRSLLYSAISLALLGLANAVLFAIQGQLLVALFHVMIYVGATVIFIIVTVAMFKEAPELPRPLITATGLTVAALGVVLASLLTFAGVLPFKGAAPSSEIVNTLLKDYQAPLLAVCLALVATLIGGTIVARRGS